MNMDKIKNLHEGLNTAFRERFKFCVNVKN